MNSSTEKPSEQASGMPLGLFFNKLCKAYGLLLVVNVGLQVYYSGNLPTATAVLLPLLNLLAGLWVTEQILKANKASGNPCDSWSALYRITQQLGDTKKGDQKS